MSSLQLKELRLERNSVDLCGGFVSIQDRTNDRSLLLLMVRYCMFSFHFDLTSIMLLWMMSMFIFSHLVRCHSNSDTLPKEAQHTRFFMSTGVTVLFFPAYVSCHCTVVNVLCFCC